MIQLLEKEIGTQIRVGYFTPYLDTDKFGILQDGEKLVRRVGN